MNENNLKPLSYLYIVLFAVIPWSLAAMQIMLGLVCVYFVFLSIAHRKNYLKKNVFYIIPGAYLASLIISAAFSIDPVTAFDNIIHTYWVILTIPVIASLPLTESDRNKGINVLIYSSAIVGLYAIFQFFSGINIISDTPLNKLNNFYRGIGTYSFFLTFAGNQLMIFAFAFIFAMQTELSSRKKLFYILAVLIIGMSLVSTQGRSSWLGAILIVLLGTFLYYRKHFWKIVGISVVLFLAVVISLPDIQDRFLASFSISHQHNLNRLNLWKTSLLMIKDHFLIGIGPGLFHLYFESYKVPGFYDAISHPHNDFLLVLVQSGIPGLVAWLMIWIVFFKRSFKFIYKQEIESSDTLIVKGAVLAIAGILVAALFQCYFVDLENSILWWVLVATAIQIFNQDKSSKN